ncbi:MAG: carbon storage regulator CsrA [Candidatus Neomarinimicrobiota bacterium]
MLVLTRKSGQSIRISNNIVVTILDNSAGQIKVGITAPDDIPIHREEIYDRIREENRAAALTAVKPQLLESLMKRMK